MQKYLDSNRCTKSQNKKNIDQFRKENYYSNAIGSLISIASLLDLSGLYRDGRRRWKQRKKWRHMIAFCLL